MAFKTYQRLFIVIHRVTHSRPDVAKALHFDHVLDIIRAMEDDNDRILLVHNEVKHRILGIEERILKQKPTENITVNEKYLKFRLLNSLNCLFSDSADKIQQDYFINRIESYLPNVLHK